MLVLGAPPQAISHKNSLDICLSNIGGRRRHEHEQPRRVDCVEAGALMRATALALDAVKSLEDEKLFTRICGSIKDRLVDPHFGPWRVARRSPRCGPGDCQWVQAPTVQSLTLSSTAKSARSDEACLLGLPTARVASDQVPVLKYLGDWCMPSVLRSSV
jgi:hypothetical protein